MFQLQICFHNQSDWENTVYKPMDYAKALELLEYYRKEWAGVHSYRIIKTLVRG